MYVFSADDMGLGKTLTMISLIISKKSKGKQKKAAAIYSDSESSGDEGTSGHDDTDEGWLNKGKCKTCSGSGH